MNFEKIQQQFSSILSFSEESQNKWQITSPLFRVDGSMFDLFLIKKENKFFLSDDDFTRTNLDPLVDINSEDCEKLIKELCVNFKVTSLKDGSFEKEVTEGEFIICASQFTNFLSMVENLFVFFE